LHLGDHHHDQGDRQGDLQAGEDLRQGGRQQNLPQHLAIPGAHVAGRPQGSFSTPAMPAMVAVTTGKMASSTTMEILDTS
jgi:hypothetical protein